MLFTNKGSVLKNVANVLFAVSMVALLGVSYYKAASVTAGFSYLVFFSVLIGGGVMAYMVCLLVYLLGELSDNSWLQRDEICALKAQVAALEKLLTPEEKQELEPVAHSTRRYTSPKVGDRWQCHKCGKLNAAEAKVCVSCDEYRK